MRKNNQRTDGRKNEWFFLFVFFLFSVGTMLLAIGCLSEVKNSFVQSNLLPLSIGICLVVSGLCGISVWFTLSGKEAWTKGAFTLYIFLLLSLLLCFILQKTGFFGVVKTPEMLQAYLQRVGIWMPIFYVLLQFLQVVLLPIPSIVSTVAGVALFGAFWAMIYSLIGILFGSILAFLIGRQLGYRAVSWMVGEETLKKWQKKMKGKDNLFLSLMFVLPVFPDDILCFVAGLSSMSWGYFLGVIFFSRLIAVSATCYSIDFIPFTTWWGITLWALFLLFTAMIFIILYKNLDKIQKALKARRQKHK